MFSGFCYRRDWLVKYAVNPVTGEAFSGYYSLDQNGNTIHEEQWTEDVDGDSWVDDVIFPSGTANPIYISDWEWMFEAFSRALEEEKIEDGYCLSVYYPGYNANGDLESGFGGTGVLWYMDAEGKVHFGADGDGMKAYLECLHNWYEKGWLDQRFMERSGDMFYRIDETSFRQGKVGLWLGRRLLHHVLLLRSRLPHRMVYHEDFSATVFTRGTKIIVRVKRDKKALVPRHKPVEID